MHLVSQIKIPPFPISMKSLQLVLALLTVIGFTSCASSTPASRSQARPAAFQAIPAAQKPTVLTGNITEGMSRDAVWVAWGPASSISQASEDGKSFEIWRYTGLRPIYRNNLGMGFGMGFGGFGGFPVGCGRNRFFGTVPFYNFDYGPDYVPFTEAVVKFRDGKVKAWERLTRQRIPV